MPEKNSTKSADTKDLPLLEVSGLVVRYGNTGGSTGFDAVKGIDFNVFPGERVALIGANGTGKTSTLRAITASIPRYAGTVIYRGIDIDQTPTYVLTQAGLVRVPEGRGIFTRLTVKENLELGGHLLKSAAERKNKIEQSFSQFPRLKERYKQSAGMLSGGEQQMLAMARALISDPKLLLLDEPSMGLSPMWVDIIFESIQMLSDQGTTILLVEQNAQRTLMAAHRAYVLESGRIVLSGLSQDLLNNPAVQTAYLGG